ncbi:hypothetical protein MNEG_12878, partial [Monoraphidium neglectum]
MRSAALQWHHFPALPAAAGPSCPYAGSPPPPPPPLFVGSAAASPTESGPAPEAAAAPQPPLLPSRRAQSVAAQQEPQLESTQEDHQQQQRPLPPRHSSSGEAWAAPQPVQGLCGAEAPSKVPPAADGAPALRAGRQAAAEASVAPE